MNKITITYPPKNPFFKHIWNTTKRYNKLWLQCTSGNSREGKTWCDITIAEHLDPKFDINKIVFTPKEFVEAVDNMKHAGECIVFSELGITHSSRQWHSLTNILTNEILQTFGYIHPIVLFDVPDFSYVDSQARKIMNCLTTVTRRGFNPPRMWLNMISVNRKDGSMYWPRPRIIDNGEMLVLRSLLFKRKPSPELLKEFIEKEEEYKGKIKKKNKRIFDFIEREDEDKTKTVTDDIEYVIKNIDEFKNIKGRVDASIIQAKLGLSYHKSRQVQKMAQLKSE